MGATVAMSTSGVWRVRLRRGSLRLVPAITLVVATTACGSAPTPTRPNVGRLMIHAPPSPTARVGHTDRLTAEPSPTATFVPLPPECVVLHEGAIALANDRAYVGLGCRILVLDIADTGRPRQLGGLTLGKCTANVYDLVTIGPRLYVAAGDTLFVVDIADDTRPEVLGSAHIGDPRPGDGIQRIAAAGRHVYSAGGSSLRVFDVADAAEPTLVAEIPSDARIRDVAFVGPRLYAATDEGLTVYDLRQPAEPRVVARLPDVRETPKAAKFMGKELLVDEAGHLFARVWDDSWWPPGEEMRPNEHAFIGLRAFDVRDPDRPVTLAADWGQVERLAVMDGLLAGEAYGGAGQSYLTFFDVSRPDQLSLTQGFGSPFTILDLAFVAPRRLLLAYQFMGCPAYGIWDVADAGPPRFVAGSELAIEAPSMEWQVFATPKPGAR